MDSKPGPQTDSPSSGTSKQAASQRRRKAASLERESFDLEAANRRLDAIYELLEPTERQWAEQSEENRNHYFKQAESDFFRIVDDYLNQANVATGLYKRYSREYQRERLYMILATGLLAAINVFASFGFVGDIKIEAWGITLAQLLNAVAALYAGFLTVGGNLQNFWNKKEKADGARETRDLLLDRYREYCFKWFYFVEPFFGTANACANAGRLYRQLIDGDHVLRQKVKDLTAIQGRETRGAI